MQQARGDERGDHPDGVEAHHGAGAQAEELADDGTVRNERGDDHGVERQPRGAGHEGRDQDGGEAVAAAGDGARGHDGGHGAGIGREQRQKRAAAESEAVHGAVGDDGGARHVAGVLQQCDDQEEKQDQRQEGEHRDDARPQAADHQRVHDARGNECAEPEAERGQQPLEESAGRSCDAEDGLEDTQGDDEEEGRAKDGMQGDAVDAARPLRGQRTAVEALVLNLGHAARTADLALLDVRLHDGQQRGLGGGGLGADEAPDRIHADCLCRR